MDPMTNRAVHLYRRLKLKEWTIEQEEQELHHRIWAMDVEEFKLYAKATLEIDSAMSDAQEIIDTSNYAHSTAKQLMSRAANHSGLDKE